MASPEIVDYARNFAVMVRVEGPDPKGLKMREHAFHHYYSGRTTLSASGLLLPDNLYDSEVAKHISGLNDPCTALVLTVSSIFEPFRTPHQRGTFHEGRPELISGAMIDIMVEGKMSIREDLDVGENAAPCWHSAQLLALIDIPASSAALQSLTDTSLVSPYQEWGVGWSLVSNANDPQPSSDVIKKQRNLTPEESGRLSSVGNLTARMAIVGVSLSHPGMENITISPTSKRGAFLLAVGSPFGVLSPVHFFNSISVGSIANCHPPNSSFNSLLMADIRCLPGMEGSPVFDEHARLIGILSRPLRQNTSGTEIQLVIPWEAIASSWSDLLQEPQNVGKGIDNDQKILNAIGKDSITNSPELNASFTCNGDHNSHCLSPSSVEKAMTSICLVTVDDGVWASGVLLNNQGLILTNAHLLEPWRFGKSNTNSGRLKTLINSELLPVLSEDPLPSNQRHPSLLLKTLNNKDSLSQVEQGEYKSTSIYRSHRGILVRMDHTQPWTWCDAKVVYICKGPLDIALLQLEQVPDQLSPIVMDIKCPSVGSKAYVIGHGLFGPKCGFSPSVCSGVVAKVIKAKIPPSYQSPQQGYPLEGFFPAMIETTAAVHPGGSGGAVVNSNGHLIGLVTSNARHGGGRVIPHLNFSIPSAALAPIFKFSKDMKNISLLQILDQPDEELSSVWALVPPLSPKPPPLPNLPQSPGEDNNNNKKSKGSSFAKFIAERQQLFKKPTAFEKPEEGLSTRVIIPSKL